VLAPIRPTGASQFVILVHNLVYVFSGAGFYCTVRSIAHTIHSASPATC